MKKLMRDSIIKKRSELKREEVIEKSNAIKTRLFQLSEFIDSKVILFYVSFRNEVDTIDMISECLNSGKRVIVPVVVPGNKNLLLSELRSIDELSPGNYGILEPDKSFIRPVSEEVIEIVIVPGVAFDKNRYRLGYGGGYYDRLIKKLPENCMTAGLAFETQIVEEVPKEEYDMMVDMIITEERIIIPESAGRINESY